MSSSRSTARNAVGRPPARMVQYAYRGGTSVSSQPLQLFYESRSFDSKQFGGLIAIAARPCQRTLDQVAFDGFEVDRHVEPGLREVDERYLGRRHRRTMQLRRQVGQ